MPELAINDSTSLDWQLSISDHLPRAQFGMQNRYLTKEPQIQMSFANIHGSLLPGEHISKHLSSFILKNPSILFEYGPVQGDSELRASMASYLKTKDIALSEEEIVITNGSQQGINLVARTFIGLGDIVIMEAPTYTAAIDVFRWQGATILSVPVDNDGMRTDLLLKICYSHSPKLIYTIPTYHNPSGTVMSMQRRKELLDIAKSFNCLIVEDDPWSELTFEKNSLPPIKSMDTDGHVIYIKGFSKFLSSGCRIGALAASGSILNRLVAAKANSDLGSPLLTQKVLLPFIQYDFIKKHLKNLNSILIKRRNLALELLTKYMPISVKWTIPQGGPNIWITLPSWLNAESLVFDAQDQNISFLCGSACYPSEPEFNHIRISFSFLDEHKLKEGIIALSNIVSSFINQKNSHPNIPII
ncbi:PLP-dependent aminotransferase family protein [Clostridium magnum]|uniref:aminotransferase-like domain-containing protein n=1 Tax=Clostridium magnum TaxID=33954 RepID=UPI0008344CDE|nr:PLP-dependent aminotransferase family protein [Clostridium magnum]